MGAALGKRVVAIFGPTTVELGFFPFRAHDRIVEKPLSCRPCSYHGSEKCPEVHFRCMREIMSRDVIDAAESLLSMEA
jgi:heptosyltransferase-2